MESVRAALIDQDLVFKVGPRVNTTIIGRRNGLCSRRRCKTLVSARQRLTPSSIIMINLWQELRDWYVCIEEELICCS